ncbi:SWIM zinc finger protein [Frondihabitans sp. PhB188]|uniref:DEAD/DEAH box helicase n=1 Tax=Frondihabitans sp. PhB188 TaxID=2485200 RepID=UPI000F47B84C|nr:DEAD/DEAH box helicase [Frondihabitans sp. PhB188]ROQ40671.1 SWIM zinc finger protein [Frondihabitans sp. PhB188]
MTEAPPLVDATDVIRLVGRPAFERAKSSVRSQLVLSTAWNPVEHRLSGSVKGSEDEPYEAAVTLTPARGDYGRPTQSSCTCFVGEACKHVAALLLAANAAKVQQTVTAGAQSVSPGAPPDPAAPAWKSALEALTGTPAPPRETATPMGLQFELRERGRTPTQRWGAPTSRPATPRSATAGGSFRLGVRPVTMSARGNWTRASLTWTTLPFSLNRLGSSPEQHRWFGQFQALHRSAREAYVPGEADWLYLDDFASPLLWPLLAEGARLGIGFVTGKRETDVTVADEARLTLDAARAPLPAAADDASIHLTPTVLIGERSHPAPFVGVVADHGVYTWAFTPAPHFTLAPTGHLTAEQRALLTSPRPIEVPAAARDEFLQEFYPRLASTVEVVSSDASVALPEIEPPMLTLTCTFEDGDRLDLEWAWEYAGRVERLSTYPVPGDLDGVLGGPPAKLALRGLDAAEFVATVLPVLEARDDVRVRQVGERPDYRELTETPQLTVTTVETDKRDWFDLGVLVTVEGRTIPFTPLFSALAKGRDKLLMVDKTYLSLKQPVFDELKRLIAEAEALDEWSAGGGPAGELHINRYQASLWSEFEELADASHQAESWRRTAEGLNGIAAGESIQASPVPDTVQAELRPYQVDGFRWLAFLYEHGLGGVLADDMGLGKTLQTLALMEHVRRGSGVPAPPFLVVAPTSVVSNWVAEAAKFTPGLRVAGVTTTAAKGRLKLDELAAAHDVIVTSYALLRLDLARYEAVDWAGLVLDEAQMIKNRQSKAHKAAVEIRAPFKLAITGTPLENDLMDLWSLFHVVSPGLLTTGLRFTEEYLKPISQHDRPDLLARLRRRVRPLMLRRTKELVASDLPEKQEQVLRVDLAPAHRKLYDLVLQRERMKLLDLVDDLDRNRFIVFRSLTLLRMLALDASLIDAEAYADVPSSKLEVLLEELADVVAGGHRALIFSQFTSYLRLVQARLDGAGIAHTYLDGSTRHRAEVIDEFKAGAAPVFLISLKAGGFGLNLTEADYVFLLDPWWNPASEAQAIDRTHRIGQTSNVMVYRMIANDTIEEKVMALKETKAKLFDAMMDDDEAAFGGSLTAADIRGLLEG